MQSIDLFLRMIRVQGNQNVTNSDKRSMDGLDSFLSMKLAIALLLTASISTVSCIDCFKCVSINHRFPPCDDPFHNNHSLALLESPCMGGRKGRDGLFPATSCIKISGTFDDTEESITVRGCGLDSGTATTDTEIIRMSHCGRFYYDERYVRGCLQSCNDADGCNGGDDVTHTRWLLFLSILILTCSSTNLILYNES